MHRVRYNRQLSKAVYYLRTNHRVIVKKHDVNDKKDKKKGKSLVHV